MATTPSIPARKRQPDTNLDKLDAIVAGASATQADTTARKNNKKEAAFLLDFGADNKHLREEIRIEALKAGVNMSQLIVSILKRRHELK